MTHRLTLRLYNRLGSGLIDGDAATGNQLLDFLDSIGAIAGRVDDLVSDTDEGSGWSALLDIDRAPDVAFLGQFVGAQVIDSHTDEQQRESVRHVEGWARGTPSAIIAAVQAHLSGDRTVNLVERDSSAYHLRVQVHEIDLPRRPAVGVPASFARASVAYNNDGSQELADAPRFAQGKFDQGILIEGAGTNLCTLAQSTDFAAGWSLFRATITNNAIAAPDGTLTADKLVEDTTATNSHMTARNSLFTVGQPASAAVYAKAGERSWLVMSLLLNLASVLAPNSTAYFDLANGEIGTVGFGITARMEDVGDGWYRCSISVPSVVDTGSDDFVIGAAPADATALYTGDGVSGLYLWHPMGELLGHSTTWQIGGTPRAADELTVDGGAIDASRGEIALWVMP